MNFDACSPAREGGAGTLRHPGTAIGDELVDAWVEALLVCVVASAWEATAWLVVDSEAITVLALEPAEPELEEPQAARIIIAAPAAMTDAAALPAARGVGLIACASP